MTLVLDGGKWSASRLGRFTPGERAPSTHWIGGWVNPRAGLDDVEKRKFLTLSGLEPDRPAHSQSLYPLRYPSSYISPCIPLKVNRRFYGICDRYLQGPKITQARNQHEAG
jgi:hypothetical protein